MDDDAVPVSDVEFLVANDFQTMARRRAHLKQINDAAEAEIKTLNLIMLSLFATCGVKSVACEGYVFTKKEGHAQDRVSPHLLLANGVSQRVIDLCTLSGASWETIAVTKENG